MSKRKKAGGRKRLPEKSQSVPAETSKNESAWADHEDNMNDFLEYESRDSNNTENENQEEAELNKGLPENEFEVNAPCEDETMGRETCKDGLLEDEGMRESDEIIQNGNAADEEQSAESETETAALAETGSEENGHEQNSKHFLHQWRQWLIGVILIFLAALYLLNNSSRNTETNLSQETETAIIESESKTAAVTKTVQVTGTSESDRCCPRICINLIRVNCSSSDITVAVPIQIIIKRVLQLVAICKIVQQCRRNSRHGKCRSIIAPLCF